MKPMRDWYKYKHDCKRCVYQGTGIVEGQQTDWYVCERSLPLETVVGRYGDAPHEYWSMPTSMLQSASDHGSTHATAALHAISGKRYLPPDIRTLTIEEQSRLHEELERRDVEGQS